jgi:hypothetical protein
MIAKRARATPPDVVSHIVGCRLRFRLPIDMGAL